MSFFQHIPYRAELHTNNLCHNPPFKQAGMEFCRIRDELGGVIRHELSLGNTKSLKKKLRLTPP